MEKLQLQITEVDIKKALANTMSDLGNQVLYDLCSVHSYHKMDQEILAKIWLIGRAYAAAIERRKKVIEEPDGDAFIENKVVPEMRNSEIDHWLEQSKNNPTAETAIEVHFKLTDLFKKISGHDKRSLASKYLHFHQPDMFFIYDSRASQTLGKVTPKKKEWLDLSPDQFDQEYINFYRRCLWLQEYLKSKIGRKLSPREIDKVLLYIHQVLNKKQVLSPTSDV